MPHKELLDGAKAIAATLNSEVGQVKFARIVKSHLEWFVETRRCGLTWEQIGSTLALSGAHRKDGRPFSKGMISSTVWRTIQAAPSKRAVSRNYIDRTSSLSFATKATVDDADKSKAEIASDEFATVSRDTKSESANSIPIKNDRPTVNKDEVRQQMVKASQARNRPHF